MGSSRSKDSRFHRQMVSTPPSLPVVETLEGRQLLYALVPAGYSRLETVQIRPAAGTYASDLVLAKGTPYFFRATGTALASGAAYHGDAAFLTGTTAASATWGISIIAGSTTNGPTTWNTTPQGDHIYGQSITPTASGPLSFSFATDAKDVASSLAVTVYAPVPSIQIAKIKNNVVVGSITSAAVRAGVNVPLNNADWDNNGTPDNAQSGAVPGDQFLLPITLPAIAGATTKSHYFIEAPKGLRVWLNPDRTGSTVGIGIRATKKRVVYLEGSAEQRNRGAVALKVLIPFSGVSVEQDVPVTVFALAGPASAAGGSTTIYSSDSSLGSWTSAIGGSLDSKAIAHVGAFAYANVAWANAAESGFVDFSVNTNFIWGLGVDVTAT